MMPSLSARRAWIEIIEEVSKYVVKESLSARRAWIEIEMQHNVCQDFAVALRKESVDRNYIIKITGKPPRGRSPQGERG